MHSQMILGDILLLLISNSILARSKCIFSSISFHGSNMRMINLHLLNAKILKKKDIIFEYDIDMFEKIFIFS